MRVEDLWKWLLIWGSLSFQTLKWGVYFLSDFSGTSIHICIQEADIAGLLHHHGSLLHLWQVCVRKTMKSICLATFPDLYNSCHISWNMCSQEAGWMLGHTLGFSHPQHLVLACHTPCHHALPCSSACTADMAIRISTWSEIWILAVTAHSWSKNRSLASSLRSLCAAYTDWKVRPNKKKCVFRVTLP